MRWNNYSISQIENDLGFHSDFPEIADGGLKRYKAGDFLGATKRYLTAYKYLQTNIEFFENIHSDRSLYLRHNVFYIYRNCAIMRLSQITMFLNEQKLIRYLPFAVVSECPEFDEELFKSELKQYSSVSPNEFFHQFYLEALTEIQQLIQHESDLKNYILEINQRLAANLLFGFEKREIKYRISGIH